MNREIINQFKEYFNHLELNNLSVLNQIYSEDMIFKDPIHQIQGVENLKQYFAKLNSNLISGTFLFTEESIVENKVYLSWDMHLKLKKPQKEIKTSGISVLTVENKIVIHRDYFDAGELFYENIPVLGSIIRLLKRKIVKGR